MSDYQAPLKDMQFVINELAGLDKIASLPGFEEATADTVEAILEQAGILASEVFSPINQSGDEAGTHIDNGIVVSPDGFVDAYQQFVENGWQGISQATEVGGQGLPYLVHSATTEMWSASNIALALCPLLTTGTIEAISQHASEALKSRFLEKLVTGHWSGTMNLTEPQAGSDLAAVRTRAVPEGEFYRITGQKIFITWGEHEMSENIIHLVLARLPDAPAGVKGISLFLVPKYHVNDDGTLGERNDLKVVSLESKLGIHASPTCVMSYGDAGGAIGYLVGEPNNGLACMFTMMNHARLDVGMQGVGLSERAYQRALSYAKDRVQGYAPGQEGRVTIIHHADVRRMLMQMRALTEASRALAYVSTAEYDLAHSCKLKEEKAKHQRRIDLLTPVAKAWSTEMAQEVTTLGVQVHGGMGFIEETGAAQYMRDARILTIYEGTTGIQGMDLIGRKLLRDKGQAMGELVSELNSFKSELEAETAELDSISRHFSGALQALDETTEWFLEQAPDNPELAGSIAVNYLMLVGNVVGGWLMAKSAIAARRQLAAGADDDFYRNKINTAIYFAEHILPRSEAQRHTIQAGSSSVMSIAVDSFGC
ncbi:MAG: acyl-CoA dehydrogenase [Gammaproteobacteria bacterium]|nr:acyl-CoA dehydrogenase [Gammaproteobacteria bacterium]